MKRFILILIVLLSFINVKAQYSQAPATPPFSFNLHGGYSWLDGVIGADFQYNHWGINGGYMPNSSPITGQSVPSWGIAGTWYSGHYYEDSFYMSLGVASTGYIEEDGFGYIETQPMTIFMGGWKFAGPKMYVKLGVGYGWNEYAGTWTGEAILGYSIFNSNKK